MLSPIYTRGMAAVSASLRFYAELNDFLPPERRARDLACAVNRASVKDLIERFGVPHTEVDLVLVNGESVGFDYIVRDGDRISVYPVFESLDIAAVSRVRPEPLRVLRFVADGHLGKLARYLRFLGFDTLYSPDLDDDELARISASEGRVLLTRDRGLLRRSMVERGYCVRDDDPGRQLEEVVRRFDLARIAQPLQRCPRCNGEMVEVEKSRILDRLEPKTRRYYDRFFQCQECEQIYWPGSHHERITTFLQDMLARNGGRAAAE